MTLSERRRTRMQQAAAAAAAAAATTGGASAPAAAALREAPSILPLPPGPQADLQQLEDAKAEGDHSAAAMECWEPPDAVRRARVAWYNAELQQRPHDVELWLEYAMVQPELDESSSRRRCGRRASPRRTAAACADEGAGGAASRRWRRGRLRSCRRR